MIHTRKRVECIALQDEREENRSVNSSPPSASFLPLRVHCLSLSPVFTPGPEQFSSYYD